MKLYYLLFLLHVLVLIPPTSFGQERTSELDYSIEEFPLPGGRLGNNVNQIVQGPYGFMWFGSHGGLHRYDGYEFITYRNDPADTLGETTSLTFPYIEGLHWGSDNKLWVATWGGGLYVFDPATEVFTHYAHDPQDSTSVGDQFVSTVLEDSQGTVWVGTSSGLCRFNREQQNFIRYPALENDENTMLMIRSLYEDRQGTVWVGSGNAFWAPMEGGLSRYNQEADSFTHYLYDAEDTTSIWTNAVRGLLEDKDGNFWVGTSMGLSKMNREDGKFQRMHRADSLPYAPGDGDLNTPAVYSILEDGIGNIWVGTIMNSNYQTHLLRYDRQLGNITEYPLNSSIWDLNESSDGTLWVATAGLSGHVLRVRSVPKPYHIEGGGADIYNAFLNYARQRNITNTFGGYSQTPNIAVDPRDNSIWEERAVLPDSQEDSATVRRWLVNYDRGYEDIKFYPILHSPTRDGSIPGNNYGNRGLLIDSRGTLWGSFPNEHIGIYNFNPATGELVHYTHDPDDSTSLSSNLIVNLFIDGREEIWAATYNSGLNRLNPKTGQIKHYHFNSTNGSDSPIAIIENHDGNIWVGGDFQDEMGTYIAIIDPHTDKIEKLPLGRGGFSVETMSASSYSQNVLITTDQSEMIQYNPNFPYISFDLPFDVAGGVEDKNGVMWAASANNNQFARIGGPNDVYIFTVASGHATVPRTGFIGPDGHVYFKNSIYWVEIDQEKIASRRSSSYFPATLVDLYVTGQKQKVGPGQVLSKPLWLSEEIKLSSDAKNFSIRFTDFSFQQSNSSYEYRLYPLENEWRRTALSPIAQYYDIPAGDYTFEVKSNQSALTVDAATKLNIIKLPVWYRTWWAYISYFLFFLVGVLVVHTFQKKRLIRREREKTKDRELAQAREIEKAYNQLKSTQTQLIHSEKMASLGELTAGIAHEIQNPLNFVNNFSEINNDLLDELKIAIKENDQEEIEAIYKDLKENEAKVTHHGKRAEGIVKSMLQHSRGGEGQKELTDINALCDEYLRLGYHGFRAKDQSFNADFKTEFDSDLPKVEVVPQDIGRVLLNLINNAFQAVKDVEKPLVTVHTSKTNDKIEIRVSDNGAGIPDDIKDKIFQPFFTTKPTGEGTGLGLSMSYDIVTKGHGGKLEVKTEKGKGSEFIVTLPIV